MIYALRTAVLLFERSNDDTKQCSLLVHSVAPYRTEWRSICGYNFLSYETQWQPRVVTCVWCIAGIERRRRFNF